MNKLKTLFRFVFISLFTFLIIHGCGTNQNIKVLVISGNSSRDGVSEIAALEKYFGDTSGVEISTMYISDLSEVKNYFRNYDVVWLHRTDSSKFTEKETSAEFIGSLRSFVSGGGKLFLTMEDVKYLNLTGIEPERLQTKYVWAKDTGFGRKLGIHAFISHPVFAGLFGGANIFSPEKDAKARQIGYFNDRYPRKGKVIAVDWAYIRLRENSKLMFEYDFGSGKVLALGAYCYFDMPNFHKEHLKKFILNSIRYLNGSNSNTEIHYWDYYSIPDSEKVKNVKYNIRKLKSLYPAEPWRQQDSFKLTSNYASKNLWDIAGRRMLVMGKEKGGIDEIWAHPFMAMRDYEVGIKFSYEKSIHWLNSERSRIEVRPESFTRIYKFRRAYLTEIVTASIDRPSAVVHYEYRGVYPAELFVKFKSNLRFMWPYSSKIFGSINYDFSENLNAAVVKDRSGRFGTVIGANKKISDFTIGRYDDIKIKDGNYATKPTDKMQVASIFRVELKMNDNIDIVVSASSSGINQAAGEYTSVLKSPRSIYLNSLKYYNNLFDNKLIISGPDGDFNNGYKWALVGADRFFVNTPGIGKSLVAGYSTTDWGWDGGQEINGRPGYAWYFGRDGAWSGFALLDYGDFGKVKEILKFFQKYQDISGKIFHELTTSGVVHYDAADSTPLYIILAGKYLRHTGDKRFIEESWENIKRAIDFCFSTDTDGDGLIENTLVGHGWVEGGALFGAHTTLYLASCWAKALAAGSEIASALGEFHLAEFYSKKSEDVIKIINSKFWNQQTGFYNYGLLRNGKFNIESTILAAIPLYFNQSNGEKAKSVLRRFAGSEFSSDWGARIISETSPLFNPRGYHYGSVWPLFTGWTSLAEYAYANGIQGFTQIMNNILVYKNWSLGFVEEVLNGEEYMYSGVCRHQCWSETMALQPAIEGMLGLKTDALAGSIELAPQFPPNWDRTEVKNIKFGNYNLTMVFKKSNGSYVYKLREKGHDEIKIKFAQYFPPGTKISNLRINGQVVFYDVEQFPEFVKANFNFDLRDSAEIRFTYKGGLTVLPIVPKPKPGYRSSSVKIIELKSTHGGYLITVEGMSGSSDTLRILSYENIGKIDGAEIIASKGETKTLAVDFPESENKYIIRSIYIRIK